jgi:hypothetical protein
LIWLLFYIIWGSGALNVTVGMGPSPLRSGGGKSIADALVWDGVATIINVFPARSEQRVLEYVSLFFGRMPEVSGDCRSY